MNVPLRKILALFTRATETTKHFIVQLIRDAVKAFGEAAFTDKMSQWLQLSKRLNSPSKLNCLHDKNHRRLIIQFMKENAIQYYTCTYFNSATIHPGYIDYIGKLSPLIFKEIVLIASRLKLVQKGFRQKMEQNPWIEDHIDAQIRIILTRFNTNKRKINSNFEKFKAIADFEDHIALVKEMSKLVRDSWKKNKQEENRIVNEISLAQVISPNVFLLDNLFDFGIEQRGPQIIIDELFL